MYLKGTMMRRVLTRDITGEVIKFVGKKMKGQRVIIFGQGVLFQGDL